MIDNKYGVPIRNDRDERRPLIQPKFTNRFRVFFPDLGNSIDTENGFNEDVNTYLTAQVESFERPSIEFNNKPVTSFLGRGFVHGRPMLGEVSFTVRDDITNTAILFLYRQLQAQIDKFYTRMRVNGELVKSPMMGQDTKFDIVMEVMDGRNNYDPIEVWEFYGCLFSNISPSGNSYEEDVEIAKIAVKCSVDSMRVYRPARDLFQSFEEENEGTSTRGVNVLRDEVGETALGNMAIISDNNSKYDDPVTNKIDALKNGIKDKVSGALGRFS